MKHDEKTSLKEIFAKANKKYGEGTIGFATDDNDLEVEAWNTNCFALNRILGNNGLVKGRVYEMFGEPSAGKSTAALFLLAQIQKQGGKVAFLDCEYSFSADYAAKVGVDMDSLIFARPENGETAFSLMEDLIHTGEVAAIVVDSTAALVPSKELEGDIMDSNVALQARMISKGLRMITGAMAKTKTIVIFISQTRSKIGGYGAMSESSGGNALKFYASVRLEVKKVEQLKKGETVVGNHLRIKAVKNKVAAPFGEAEIDLYFESGFDLTGEVFDHGLALNLILKTGNTYSFDGTRLGIGRDNAKETLINDSILYEKIRKAIESSSKGEVKTIASAKT